MRYIQQLDETDCGAACLAMVASHYGRRLSIAEVRNVAGTDTIGTNIRGMVLAANKYGLTATPVKGDKTAITTQLQTPFIVHMHITRDGTEVDHFVVVHKITRKKIEIWDPSPLHRKQRISYDQFFEWWTGYAIFFAPDDTFTRTEKKQNLLLKFLPVFVPHTRILVYSFIASILLLLFGIITSFYYKYIFDEVIYTKSAFSLHTLSFGMLLITIVQLLMETFRSVLLSHFSFKTDLQLNFSYLSHILKLPLSFFESRKSGEILSRLGDLNKIKQTLSSAALSGVMDIIMILVSGPVLLSINTTLFGISLVTVLLAALISVAFARIYRSYYSKVMSQDAEVQSYLYESLNGVATVKALNAEDIVNREYEKKENDCR